MPIPVTSAAPAIHRVPIDLVDPNPANPRIAEAEDHSLLQSLADSLRRNGQLQPCGATQMLDGRWRLVYGNRRLAAARLAGLSHIDLVEASDDAVTALSENIQRRSSHPLETATTVAAIVGGHRESGKDQAEAVRLCAASLCVDRSFVVEHLGLATIAAGTRAAILDAERSTGTPVPQHCLLALSMLPEDEQAKMLLEWTSHGFPHTAEAAANWLDSSILGDLDGTESVPYTRSFDLSSRVVGRKKFPTSCNECPSNTTVARADSILLDPSSRLGAAIGDQRCMDQSCWMRKQKAARALVDAGGKERPPGITDAAWQVMQDRRSYRQDTGSKADDPKAKARADALDARRKEAEHAAAAWDKTACLALENDPALAVSVWIFLLTPHTFHAEALHKSKDPRRGARFSAAQKSMLQALGEGRFGDAPAFRDAKQIVPSGIVSGVRSQWRKSSNTGMRAAILQLLGPELAAADGAPGLKPKAPAKEPASADTKKKKRPKQIPVSMPRRERRRR